MLIRVNTVLMRTIFAISSFSNRFFQFFCQLLLFFFVHFHYDLLILICISLLIISIIFVSKILMQCVLRTFQPIKSRFRLTNSRPIETGSSSFCAKVETVIRDTRRSQYLIFVIILCINRKYRGFYTALDRRDHHVVMHDFIWKQLFIIFASNYHKIFKNVLFT